MGDAAATKAPIAKVADKVSGVFVPVVMAVAVLTIIVWLAFGETDVYKSKYRKCRSADHKRSKLHRFGRLYRSGVYLRKPDTSVSYTHLSYLWSENLYSVTLFYLPRSLRCV